MSCQAPVGRVSALTAYLFCGEQLESDLDLPGLPIAGGGKGQISFSLDGARALPGGRPWSHHWLSPGGERLISYCQSDSFHWLQFPGLAEFQIADDASSITCHPAPGIPAETIRHLLLDQVLPRCLAHRGALMLHASAVKFDRGLVLFTGESHAGKSTLAASLHQAGYLAVSDDVVRITDDKLGIGAIPSFGGLRLWDDSLETLFDTSQRVQPMAHYSEKKRLVFGESNQQDCRQSSPIVAVIVLSSAQEDTGSGPVLDPLSQREALLAIGRQTFVLEPSLESLSRQILAVGRIVSRLNSFRLPMPHDYSSLPKIRLLILEQAL